MADASHFEILKQGVKAWNAWRDNNPYLRPDLREADLQGINIRDAYLAESDLSRVDFSGRDLSSMHFDFADFTEAKFNDTNLTKLIYVGRFFSGQTLLAQTWKEQNCSLLTSDRLTS